MHFSDGKIYEGQWEKDLMNGEGKLIMENGAIIEAFFQDGGIKGDVEIKYPNNDRYVGTLKKGKKEGEGNYIFANGDKY